MQAVLEATSHVKHGALCSCDYFYQYSVQKCRVLTRLHFETSLSWNSRSDEQFCAAGITLQEKRITACMNRYVRAQVEFICFPNCPPSRIYTRHHTFTIGLAPCTKARPRVNKPATMLSTAVRTLITKIIRKKLVCLADKTRVAAPT